MMLISVLKYQGQVLIPDLGKTFMKLTQINILGSDLNLDLHLFPNSESK